MSTSNLLLKARQLGCVFFFFSGLAALVYEVIWVRILGLVFGNTTYAVSTVLAVFMAGLGIGSYLVGRRADRWPKPLKIYGILELGIGGYAAFTFLFLWLIQYTYTSFAASFNVGITTLTMLRLCLSGMVLFVPTFLMGATFPVLMKFYSDSREKIGPGAALLYGLNIAGAVVGTLLAGYWFIPALGLTLTLFFAVVLNLGIGFLACYLSWHLSRSGVSEIDLSDQRAGSIASGQTEKAPVFHNTWLPFGLFASGIIAMIYQVGWTRLLASLLGSSTYAFTSMLAAFLFGMFAGSIVYKRILSKRPATVFDWVFLQLLIAVFVALTLPYYERIPIVTVRLFGLTYGHPGLLELARFCFLSVFMVIPAFAFGAIFPVSVALFTQQTGHVGRGTGNLYLANTFGNIIGSLYMGFVMIPVFGIFKSLQFAVIIGIATAIGVFIYYRNQVSRIGISVVILLAVIVAGSLWSKRHGWDPHLIGSQLSSKPEKFFNLRTPEILRLLYGNKVLYYREGLSSNVCVVYDPRQEGVLVLRVNGKDDASTVAGDMKTQILLGQLPHLLHPAPEQTLIIGFGSGVTLASSLTHPVKHVDMVEIERAVLDAAPFFDSVNHQCYNDPRVRLIVNDGRNHLLVEKRKYDVIISEPPNPWMAGVASLFTIEYFDLVKDRLNTNGVFCQWVQAYKMSPDDFKMVVASVREVFPHVTLWESTSGDFLIMAGLHKLTLDIDKITARIEGSHSLRRKLETIGIRGGGGLLTLFRLSDSDVERFVQGADLNTDGLPLLEFNAPFALYSKNTVLWVNQMVDLFHKDKYPPIKTNVSDINKNADILTEIGYSYLSRKEVKLSRQYFDKALKSVPGHNAALLGTARILLSNDNLEEARQNIQDVLNHNPESADNHEAMALMGRLLIRTGEIEKGIKSLDKAIALVPDRTEYLRWRASGLRTMKNYSEAANDFEKLSELRPLNLQLKMDYARMLQLTSGYDVALDFLTAVQQDNPQFYPVYKNLSAVLTATGSFNLLILFYEELVQANPYDANYWIELIKLYEKTGHRRKSAWAIKKGRKTHQYFDALLAMHLQEQTQRPSLRIFPPSK